MSSLLIRNGLLVTLNERHEILESADVYIEGAKIKAVGRHLDQQVKAQRTLDARGRVVMPGLINCHHHLYSTFARGFSPPGEPARNFKEILERLWWKLDRALQAEDVYYSAVIPLMEAARAGCTCTPMMARTRASPSTPASHWSVWKAPA